VNKTLSMFLDRLTERFTAMLAGVISSRVTGMHAVAQAEQQSQLEDLARQYESEGKFEIAARLRERAITLTSSDLAAEALEIVERTTAEPPRLSSLPTPEAKPDLQGLPDFAQKSPKSGRKKAARANQDSHSSETTRPAFPSDPGESR
jgi:hypothetical protein